MSIKSVLMKRDGCSAEEADAQIEEARQILQEYLAEGDMESAHEICEEMFGLEPDYLFELI